MRISKKSKVLALALCLAMLMCAMPMMAMAEGTPSLVIGEITSSKADSIVTVTVPYTAANVQDVTILATIGGELPPAADSLSNSNIGYIDQQASATTILINDVPTPGFRFLVDESKFSAENCNLHIKMGGTALDTAQSADPIIVVEQTTTYKVYGYVNVPAAVGSTVTLKDGTQTTTDAEGYFEFTGVDNGSYNLAVGAKSALTRTIPVTVADADFEVSTSANKISLMFGDVDGNGIIELDDLMKIKSTYNKESTDTGYNLSFDLDSNGIIELDDLMAIKGNYNKIIANYPEWIK